MAAAVRGVDLLEEQLNKAKERLKDVDENIKKLTGRAPDEFSRPGQRRVSTGAMGDRGRGRLFTIARRGIVDDAPPAKRRAIGTPFSRLGGRVGRGRGRGRRDSGDEDELQGRHSLPSVVQASDDSRSRKDTIEKQNKDERGNARNRRMFGLLMGTLQKFKDDSKTKKDQEQRRLTIEKKLEDRAVQEKEDLKKERQSLFNARRRNQQELRQLETKMELVEMHKNWERETKKLSNFIRSRARPHIYYLPKEMIPSTIRKQQDTRKFINELVTKRKKKLEEEIDALVRMHAEDEDGDEEEEEEEDEEEEPARPKHKDEEPVESRIQKETVPKTKHTNGEDKENSESNDRNKSPGVLDEDGWGQDTKGGVHMHLDRVGATPNDGSLGNIIGQDIGEHPVMGADSDDEGLVGRREQLMLQLAQSVYSDGTGEQGEPLEAGNVYAEELASKDADRRVIMAQEVMQPRDG